MLARRTIARIGGRAAAFLVAVALAGATLTAAAIVPWPEHRTSAPSLVVQPAESRQQRVCPGPLMTLADDAAAATTASSVGSAAVVTGAEPAAAAIEQTPISAPENPRADRDGTPTVIATEPGDVAVGLLAGAQSQTAATETVAGFAATACAEAVSDTWLVAGATNLGRTSLVLLSNPTDVAATVDVRVSGESGPVEAASALGLIVPAGSQRVLSLAGLAPNLEAPVVHVESTGGAIVASLEHSVVQGLAPSGVELSGATATPANRQVIPGFVVARAGGVDPADDHALGDDFPAVRLFAPGDEPVEASIGIVSETGASGSTIDVTLQPGNVSDVPLGVLEAGSYTLRIEADAPIVAAARATTGVPAESGGADAAASVDLAWTVATMPLLDEAVVVVPQGPSPVLHFASTGTDAIEATITVDGTERPVTVPAGGAATVALEPGAVVQLDGVEGLHASMSFSGTAALASFGVQPPGAQDAPIRVYPR